MKHGKWKMENETWTMKKQKGGMTNGKGKLLDPLTNHVLVKEQHVRFTQPCGPYGSPL